MAQPCSSLTAYCVWLKNKNHEMAYPAFGYFNKRCFTVL
jgi:hypothetical protein